MPLNLDELDKLITKFIESSVSNAGSRPRLSDFIGHRPIVRILSSSYSWDRILDRRLQALKKAGLIRYVRGEANKSGWEICRHE